MNSTICVIGSKIPAPIPCITLEIIKISIFGEIKEIIAPIKNIIKEDIKIVFTLKRRAMNADKGIITPKTSKNEEYTN